MALGIGTVLIYLFACNAVAEAVERRLHRNGAAWFLASLILTPIITIPAALGMGIRKRTNSRQG